MFSDEEYKAIIQANQHKPTVSEDQRFGVHFEYKDLCLRLNKLSLRQQRDVGAHSEEKFPALRDKPRELGVREIRAMEPAKTQGKASEKRSKSSLKIASKTTASNAALPRSLSPIMPKNSSRARLRSLSPLEDLLSSKPYGHASSRRPLKVIGGEVSKPMLRKSVKGAVGRRL